MQRRKFIQALSIAGIGSSIANSFAFDALPGSSRKTTTIGWITDVHHGYCKDAGTRLETFINTAIDRNPHFIIQGGDFCHPSNEARPFIETWKRFKGQRYHVLGNHDMDKGSKKQIMDLWEMEKNYYSFDQGDFHFVVMDCNHIFSNGKYLDFANSNYYINAALRDLVDPEQIEWLRSDLQQSKKPCIIISHQSFDEVWTGNTVPNRLMVRKVIDEINAAEKTPKVIACFCGHHHLDHHMVLNKVHYFHINSASYYYVGDGFGSDGGQAVYADPLFCFVTLDPRGEITIEGRRSHFLTPSPAEKGFTNADRLSASILNRKIRI